MPPKVQRGGIAVLPIWRIGAGESHVNRKLRAKRKKFRRGKEARTRRMTRMAGWPGNRLAGHGRHRMQGKAWIRAKGFAGSLRAVRQPEAHARMRAREGRAPGAFPGKTLDISPEIPYH